MGQTAFHHPFRTDVVVILQEHQHAIWTLPEGDADYPTRWRAIKARFNRGLLAMGITLLKTPRG